MKIITHGFKPWFKILMHTQCIVCATVDGQCLEYLEYIILHRSNFVRALLLLICWIRLLKKVWKINIYMLTDNSRVLNIPLYVYLFLEFFSLDVLLLGTIFCSGLWSIVSIVLLVVRVEIDSIMAKPYMIQKSLKIFGL